MPERTTEEAIREYRVITDDYNSYMKELSVIRRGKALKIIALMAEHKTVNRAELYFSATEEGQREQELILLSKGLEKLISSINSELKMKRNEYWSSN